jgi:hypothetical protein
MEPGHSLEKISPNKISENVWSYLICLYLIQITINISSFPHVLSLLLGYELGLPDWIEGSPGDLLWFFLNFR